MPSHNTYHLTWVSLTFNVGHLLMAATPDLERGLAPLSLQNKNTNPIISRQDYHLTQPCPSEEKQTDLSTNLTLYYAYTNHWSNLRREETKRKKEFHLLQGKKFNFNLSL